jgi:hypothetical protein
LGECSEKTQQLVPNLDIQSPTHNDNLSTLSDSKRNSKKIVPRCYATVDLCLCLYGDVFVWSDGLSFVQDIVAQKSYHRFCDHRELESISI